MLDQKIRVLYAEGPPRWEYRYLKNALIRDTTMEAQVFLFSADANFIQESSPGVPPLAELPRTREALFAYHHLTVTPILNYRGGGSTAERGNGPCMRCPIFGRRPPYPRLR